MRFKLPLDLEANWPHIEASNNSSNARDILTDDKVSNGVRKNETKNNDESANTDDVISGKLVIVVTDSGAGLSEVNLKRLFKEVGI